MYQQLFIIYRQLTQLVSNLPFPNLKLFQNLLLVTGVNFYITTFPICLICIVLTSIGGSKAVILTNFYQFIILFCIYGTTYILGFKQVGSFKSIWRKSEAKRDFYTFDLNPTTYTTFWSVLIGLSVHFLANLAVNQCYFQKFAAVNNFKFSKRYLNISIIRLSKRNYYFQVILKESIK